MSLLFHSFSASGDSKTLFVGSSRHWLIVIGIIVMLLGCGLGYSAAIQPTLLARDARHWIATEATVLTSKMIYVTSGGENPTTHPEHEMSYAYLFNGQRYVSKQQDLSRIHGTQDEQQVNELIAAHPVGSKITCYVNPADPSQATIGRDVGWPEVIVGILAGIIIIGGAITAVINVRRTLQWRRVRKAKASPGLIPFEPKANTLIFKFRARRFLIAIIFTTIALIVSGVTAFMYYTAAGTPFTSGMILAYIFLMVFTYGGVMVLIATIGSWLQMTNPLPQLALSPGILRPGQPFELIWSITSSRINRLVIKLQAINDKAPSQKKEDSDGWFTVDEGVLLNIPIVDTTSLAEIAAGRFTMTLPADVPVTDPDNDSEITWKFKVRGYIHLWPDISDKYTVFVLPAKQGDTIAPANALDQ